MSVPIFPEKAFAMASVESSGPLPETGLPHAPVMSERMVSLLGALFVVIGPMSMALYTPAMPEIVKAFATTESTVKLTLALYFAGFAFAQLLAGPLSDALGRKPVLVGFMAIYFAGSLYALFAPSIDHLLAARFAQGVGASAGIAVSRAVVRDLFAHEQSARIMNMIGIMLALGPAVAPTIGGFTMVHAGWQAIFLVMAGLGLIVMAAALFVLKETAPKPRQKLVPSALFATYGRLIGDLHFMTTALVIACTTGALYAQATFLPFILMSRVGLSPAEFGLSMIAQSGTFLAGALMVRSLMRTVKAARLVVPGLFLVALGSLGLLALPLTGPSFLHVMGPIALFAGGIAFVMPHMTVACLAPHGRIAGAASAMMGFLQMGLGLAMGAVGAAMGDPVRSISMLIPAMGAASILFYAVYRLRYAASEKADPRGDVIASIPPGRTLSKDG